MHTASPSVTAPVSGVSPLSLLLRFGVGAGLMWTLSRLLLAVLHQPRLAKAEASAQVLLIGLRVDLITLGWTLALPLLLLPLTCGRLGLRLWSGLVRVGFAVVLTLILVLEVAAPAFLGEYEQRPNQLFLDYLGRPQEVVPMLWGGFRASLLAGIAALFLGAWGSWTWMQAGRPLRCAGRREMLAWPLLIVLCVLMIRSSLEHRPANPALFARWDDTLVNQVALNSSYTLGFAIYAHRHEADVGSIYGRMSEKELLQILHGLPEFAGNPPGQPTRRLQAPSFPRQRPLNLILVVEESLGAGFSAALGGESLTPEFDQWADRGWWFERLYATGTRSARGLEAIVAGFPPSPAQSVLKRERSQHGFTTLASVLRAAGYHCEFIYGGESHFDNMRGFFLGNGFHHVIDQADYAHPQFRGSWGVSDEDLFDQAQARAEALHQTGQPFFSLVFSSSNHTPFEYPEGRIVPLGDDPHTVQNAVRYADYAVARFLKNASQSRYFADTLVMVVADHDVRVYGDAIVPLERFHIPGLLVGADLAPRRLTSIASQIDLAPTLLSVMGVPADIPFPGRDLTRSLQEFGAAPALPPRALLQFNRTFAYLQDDVLSVLLPGGEMHRFRAGDRGRSLTELEPPDESARRQLLAMVHLPQWLYASGAYHDQSTPPD